MRFTDHVLSLHPAIVTIAFAILFAGGGLALNIPLAGSANWTVILSVTTLIMLAPLFLWHYSLYRAASDRNVPGVGHGGRRAWVFILAVAGIAAQLVLFPVLGLTSRNGVVDPTLNAVTSFSAALGCLGYFSAIWAAANALTRFDERAKSVEFHKTLGTFFLEFYLPFGIWVIYPRIKRLLAEPIPG